MKNAILAAAFILGLGPSLMAGTIEINQMDIERILGEANRQAVEMIAPQSVPLVGDVPQSGDAFLQWIKNQESFVGKEFSEGKLEEDFRPIPSWLWPANIQKLVDAQNAFRKWSPADYSLVYQVRENGNDIDLYVVLWKIVDVVGHTEWDDVTLMESSGLGIADGAAAPKGDLQWCSRFGPRDPKNCMYSIPSVKSFRGDVKK